MQKRGRVCWREPSGNAGHGDWWPLEIARIFARIYEGEGARRRIVKVEVKEDHELETAAG